jgi:uncharacterized protein YndB with AHSA1/START domain
MGKEFEVDLELAVDATPDQVWDAIATGPGIDSWFMGRNEVEPGVGGAVRTAFGAYNPQHTITDWQPNERLAYGSSDPDGRRLGYEFLIEGRDGGSTVVRMVTSGFLPGDDWADEYDAMAKGLAMFIHTLREYLAHFPGRTAARIIANAPQPGDDWRHDWAVLHDALGLNVPAEQGDRVTIAPAGLPPIDGVVYYTNPDTVGIRTDDALYRFLGGRMGPINASHHLFGPDVDEPATESAWAGWLAETLRSTR